MADKRLSKDQASRQMAAADKRVKGISSIADSAVKRSKILEIHKQYGSDKGNRQAVTSVDKALNSLSKTTQALAKGVKLITVETARGVKNITASGAKAMNEYAKAITEDIHINRQNLMVTTIGKFTPLVGYAVAKMMETTVFRNMIDKMKIGLGKALDSVTSRFKRLASMGWEKGKEFWGSMMDRISGKRGAVKTKMANARQVKQEKKYFTKESAIKDALADAKVQAAAKKASRTKTIEKQVPHMASGGYVQKEGLAKVHAAEVVQPVDKIVETIVETVNKRLDKERKDTPERGFESMFKKSKEKDLFGMEKASDTIKNVFQIMQRKNLALEQRVMKRDKKNQQGLIGSFMTAYGEEAKQEELPLMERQVRATLAVKEAIAGENKNAQVAWQKMLYEHPFFHASYLAAKTTSKLFTSPLKFIFKKRGMYANKLKASGTVFERIYDASSQTFTGLMEKLDDVIYNLYSIAGSTKASAEKAGASTPKSLDAKKAPKQKGYSIAGLYAKLLYATHVKYPAKAIGWAGKKLANTFGSQGTRNWWKKATAEGSGVEALKKARDNTVGKAWTGVKNKWNRRNESGTAKRARLKREATKAAALKAAEAKKDEIEQTRWEENKKFKKLKKAGWDQRKAAKQIQRDRDRKAKREELDDDGKRIDLGLKRKAGYKDWLKWKKDPERLRNKLNRQRENFYTGSKKKKEEFSSGGKDRTGKKTTAGKLDELVTTNKKQLKVGVENKNANVNTLTRIGKGAKTLWSWIGIAASWLFKAPGMIGGWIKSGLTSLAGAGIGTALAGIIGPAIAIALGSAVVYKVLKSITDPFLKKKYDEVDKKNADAYSSDNDILSKSKIGLKESRAKGDKKGILTNYMKINQSASIGRNSSKAKKDYGLFTFSINYDQITSGQKKYMAENIGKYVDYGPDQVERLREKWTNMQHEMKPFKMSYEQYGINREKSFLAYLKSQGKVLTNEQISNNQRINRVLGVDTTPKNTKATTTSKARFERSASKRMSSTKKQMYESKVNNLQASITEWLPLANQFGGNTTAGMLAANFVMRKSGENPTSLLSTVNKITSFSKEQWMAFNGNPQVHDAAMFIKNQKESFKDLVKKAKETQLGQDLSTTQKSLKSTAQQASDAYTESIGFGGSKMDAMKAAAAEVTAGSGTAYNEFVTSESGQKALQAMNSQIANSTEAIDSWRGMSAQEKLKQLKLLSTTGVNNLVIKAEKANEKYGISEKAASGYSQAKQIVSDLATNAPGMLSTMKENAISAFIKMSDFFEQAYGDPKQFYADTKEKLWGGITSIKESSIAMFQMQKAHLIWEAQQAGYMGGNLPYDIPELSGVNVREKLSGMSGMNANRVAQINARQDIRNAELSNNMVAGLNGVKESVDMGTKSNTTLINTVNNNSSSTTVANSSRGGGNNQNSSCRDDFVNQILTDGLS